MDKKMWMAVAACLIISGAVGVLVGLLAGCGTIPQPKSCLPEALMMQRDLSAKGVLAGVLVIQYSDERHAIACYETDPNHGYGWDINWGSVPLFPWGWDAETTGLQWSERWMPRKVFERAWWEVGMN